MCINKRIRITNGSIFSVVTKNTVVLAGPSLNAFLGQEILKLRKRYFKCERMRHSVSSKVGQEQRCGGLKGQQRPINTRLGISS